MGAPKYSSNVMIFEADEKEMQTWTIQIMG